VGTIVVGVDGSESSKAALRFALEEACLRGASVLAVHASTFAHLAAGFAMPLEPGLRRRFRQEAEDLLDSVLSEVAADAADVKIERAVVEEPAAKALVEAAEGADLLVLGSRGLGGFRSLLLGSVGLQCAHHAPCPVVIVRGR